MTYFCANCGNLLIVEQGTKIFFKCSTCPYKFTFDKKIVYETDLKRKQIDAVLGEEQWKNAQRTESLKCGCKSAYFMQIQIRSADEPMTTFYKCSNFSCGWQWRDG
ncbi:DNA-directed RNA polymerase subunit [Entamoeba marina]